MAHGVVMGGTEGSHHKPVQSVVHFGIIALGAAVISTLMQHSALPRATLQYCLNHTPRAIIPVKYSQQ